MIKVRYSKAQNDLIEFDTELSGIPIEEDKADKDVIVQWHLYDGFDANKTFWTDSNGLEMRRRKINA